MYVPALDLKHGLVPYKEILIAYGYLTTWIQSVSLTVLGDSLMSIGIVTGLFYSLAGPLLQNLQYFPIQVHLPVRSGADFSFTPLYCSSLA